VSIFGDRDVFVKSWSSVNLKCVISGTSANAAEPSYIEWRRDGVRLAALSGASFGTFGPAGRVRYDCLVVCLVDGWLHFQTNQMHQVCLFVCCLPGYMFVCMFVCLLVGFSLALSDPLCIRYVCLV
jgi:hypothetical protein